MRVDFEYLEALYSLIDTIDRHPFGKIQFYRNGKKLQVTAHMRERWKYICEGNSKFFRYYDLMPKQNKKPKTRKSK